MARGGAARTSGAGRQLAGTTLVGYCDAVAAIDSGDEATFEAVASDRSGPRRFKVRFE